MTNKLILPALLSLLWMGCMTGRHAVKTKNDSELEKLADLMTGRFTSEAQSKSDSTYFNISLIMTKIWPERTDGIWLYVEQAVATKMDKPYRQRVYQLRRAADNTFTSDIYTIKDALKMAGLTNDPEKKAMLTFDKIELKEGCTVTLKRQNDLYTGGTEGANCPSDLRGASYATTKITLKPGELISWDQGFDASGKQVWGAVKGGYVFLKQKQAPAF